MNLKIYTILDNGKQENERLLIKVLQDDNTNNYLVLDTTYGSDGKVSNKHKHPFWFPKVAVKKGDHVVLYSRKGTYSTEKHTDNTTIHYFFWNLDSCVWNNDGDKAYLLQIASVDSKSK